jgi:hypothetical protein
VRLTILALFVGVLPLAVQAGILFSDAKGPKCHDYSKPEFGDWTCPGPGNYAVRFTDEGNIVSLTFAPAQSVRKVKPTAHWLGANKAFGDKVEWIVRGGVPKAAVVRTWRRGDVNDTTEIQELSVFTIDKTEACSYSAVDVHHPNASETAAAQAEQAADMQCGKD